LIFPRVGRVTGVGRLTRIGRRDLAIRRGGVGGGTGVVAFDVLRLGPHDERARGCAEERGDGEERLYHDTPTTAARPSV